MSHGQQAGQRRAPRDRGRHTQRPFLASQEGSDSQQLPATPVTGNLPTGRRQTARGGKPQGAA